MSAWLIWGVPMLVATWFIFSPIPNSMRKNREQFSEKPWSTTRCKSFPYNSIRASYHTNWISKVFYVTAMSTKASLTYHSLILDQIHQPYQCGAFFHHCRCLSMELSHTKIQHSTLDRRTGVFIQLTDTSLCFHLRSCLRWDCTTCQLYPRQRHPYACRDLFALRTPEVLSA